MATTAWATASSSTTPSPTRWLRSAGRSRSAATKAHPATSSEATATAIASWSTMAGTLAQRPDPDPIGPPATISSAAGARAEPAWYTEAVQETYRADGVPGPDGLAAVFAAGGAMGALMS